MKQDSLYVAPLPLNTSFRSVVSIHPKFQDARGSSPIEGTNASHPAVLPHI
jgi:hypothetical protein